MHFQGFPKLAKSCSHFSKMLPTIARSEGYSSNWLIWPVCREPPGPDSIIFYTAQCISGSIYMIVYVYRVWLSSEEPTSCSVVRLTELSRYGTSMKWHMWRHCKYMYMYIYIVP